MKRLFQKNSLLIPLLAAYAGHILWGFSTLFTKAALAYASPNHLLSIRFLFSAILMALWVLVGKKKVTLKGKRLLPLLLLILLQVLYYLFESYGILYTNATISGVVLAVVPIVALGTAALFLKEYPTRRQAFFCLFPVVGVVLMTVAGTSLGVAKPIGLVLLGLSAVSSALYKTANRAASTDFSVFERSFFVISASGTFFTLMALKDVGFSAKAYFEPLTHLPFTLCVFALGVLCTIGANLLVNFAVSRMQVVKLSAFGAITTLVSMCAGVLFLHEPVSLSLILGAVLILVGVHQVTRPAEARPVPRDQKE